MNTAVALQPAYTYSLQAGQRFNESFFERFIDYTDRKESTVKGYLTCIRQFIKWMQENGITQPQRDDIRAYRDFLRNSHLAAGTQQQYLRAVKHFFKWTAAENLYPNIADNIHGAKIRHKTHKKDALTRCDIPKIAESIDRSTEQGKRLYAMYLLGTVCSLRTIEMHRANIEDIEIISGDPFLFIQRKGHDEKDAKVSLNPDVYSAIKDYLASRTDKPTGKSPLFISTSNRSKGSRIATTTISTMLKEMLKAAGYDSARLTAHSLRHTSGTGAIKTGLDLREAQILLGHENPTTTEIYIHDDNINEIEKKGRQTIFDYFFHPEKDKKEILPELQALLETMSKEQQTEIYLTLKKGANL